MAEKKKVQSGAAAKSGDAKNRDAKNGNVKNGDAKSRDAKGSEPVLYSFAAIQKNEEINALIEQGNRVLSVLGYTEHSKRHASKVSAQAGMLLESLGYGAHDIELARIAGYMHDIGNAVNRHDHAHSGALLAYQILKGLGMPLADVLIVTTAIGHHDEQTGTAVDPVSAALILADKTDVRRNRVQNPVIANFDAHDRVNYAALKVSLVLKDDKKEKTGKAEKAAKSEKAGNAGKTADGRCETAGAKDSVLAGRAASAPLKGKIIQMNLTLDDEMSSVMDYFEIFLERMIMCRRAAEVLGCRFKLVANGSKLC